MKTTEEFYREIIASTVLQEELKAASDEMLGAFLTKHGCDSTAKDFIAFVRSQDEGEIEDNDVEAIVGGLFVKPMPTPPRTPVA